MRKKFKIIVFMTGLLACFLAVGKAQATPSTELYSWSIKIDSSVYNPGDVLPPAVDMSAFDTSTGLGEITVSLSSASGGSFSVLAFLDHEIDELVNTFFNEDGLMHGTAPLGMSWEIDEPGYSTGDIYSNFLADALDNSVGAPGTVFPDDVSMAIGWHFDLLAGESAVVKFTVSLLDLGLPALEQFDPDSMASLFFSSTLTKNEIPEPATLSLLGMSLLAGQWRRRQLKKAQPHN